MQDSILLIEGEGDERQLIDNYILKNNLENNVKILGFSQYKKHSWLIRNSDIVIVPSHEDNWGIVVDEGLKLNKIVISTYSTGSAVTLITHEKNGFLYNSYNTQELTKFIDISILKSRKAKSKPLNEIVIEKKLSKSIYQNLVN